MSVLLKLIVFISFSTSLVLSMDEDPTQLKGRALVKYRNDLKEKEKEGRRKRSEAAAKERVEKEEAEALKLRNIEQAAREAAAKERREKEETDARQRREKKEASEKLASEFQDQLSIVGLLPEAVSVEKKKQPSKAERREFKRLAEEREKEEDKKRVAAAIAAKERKEKTDQAKLAKKREGIDPKAITMASSHFQYLSSAFDAPLIAAASNLALGAAMNNVLLNIDFRIAKLWPHKESFLEYLNLRQGDPQAIYQLGRCHEDGFAVSKQDIDAAKNCFRRAANAGHEKARERLHVLEEGGEAISSLIEFVGSSSEQKITYEVLQNAIAGDAEEQFHVGYCYENGFGICQSFTEAAIWYHFAAEKKHTDAENKLAWFYKHGIGVEINNVTSAQFYKKVAKKGERSAQCNFAICCEHGDGVEPSLEKAVLWLRKSSDQRFPPAQLHFGLYLMHGLGVEQSRTEGIKLIRRSASQGFQGALDVLDQIKNGKMCFSEYRSKLPISL
jgi:TPR repeat protein